MTKDKKTAIPPLRFPEFRNTEGWDIGSIGNLYEFKPTNTLSRESLNYTTGFVKNIHYGDIHTKFSTLFDIRKEKTPYINLDIDIDKYKSDSFCQVSDVIFADASEDLEGIGKCIEIVNLNNEKVLSGLHTILARQRDNNFITGFAGYLFMSDQIKTQINKESQGAKVLGISSNRLSNILLYYPKNTIEQQKIADCLSSLDDLISAVADKIETLKKYKQGLMQQLFPSEGKTTPTLRFPEFQNSGDWKETTIANVGEIITGNTPSTKDQSNYGGDKLFVSPVDISDERYIIKTKTTLTKKGFSQARQIKENSILFVCIGSTIGKIAQNKIECTTNQQINSIIPRNGYNADFIYSILEYKAQKIASIAGNQAVPIINKTLFSSVSLLIPKEKEQEKIANCLLSVDELISTEKNKLNQLKSQKKGLFQQLFPFINE